MAYVDVAETISPAQAGFAEAVIERVSSVAAAALSYGLLVSEGATAGKCKRPAAAGDVTAGAMGFVERIAPHADGAAGSEFASGEVVTIVRKGRMWVNTEGAVTRGAVVYVRHTANGGETTLGKVRADADTDKASALPNSQFITGTTGAGLALIEFSLP